MEWNIEAGKRIENLRKERNMTQQELADSIGGLKRVTVKDWECFNRKPNVEMLIKLANYFGVTVDYLIGHSDSKYPADNDITILTDRFGFSQKAARELRIISNPGNGAWAAHRFEALNRLIEESDTFEGILIGLWQCMTFGQTLTYYEAEFMKSGKAPDSNEELFILADRNTFRSAIVYNPQSLLSKFADALATQSENDAKTGDPPKKTKKGRKSKSSMPSDCHSKEAADNG